MGGKNSKPKAPKAPKEEKKKEPKPPKEPKAPKPPKEEKKKAEKPPKEEKKKEEKKKEEKPPKSPKVEKPKTPKVDKKKLEAATLKDAELELLTQNTHFNRDEVIAIHKDFIKDCPNGKINKKDFAKLFKSLHPLDNKKVKVDKYCEFAFNAFDKNHDGYIDFQEFCVAFSVTSSGELREKVQFAFRHFDSNRDEKINQADVLKVVQSLYDLNGIPEAARKGDNDPKKRVEQVFKRLDVNNKKTLTLNEFIDGCLNDQAVREFLVDSLFSN